MNKPIAIEISALGRGQLTGIGYYLQHLLTALLMANPQTTYELLWFKGESPPAELLSYPNVTGRPIPLPRKVYKLLLLLKLAPALDHLSRSQAELFFFPSFASWPLSKGKQAVCVVYDTAFIDYPKYLRTKRQGVFLKRSIQSSTEEAAAVVAISQSTKASLVKNFKTNPAKISVITPAIDHIKLKPSTPAAVAEVKSKFGIKANYILYLGTLEPRKNVAGAIKAYLALPLLLKQQYQLVLAGAKGWDKSSLRRELHSAGASQIIATGYVDEADKPALYTGADLFIFPSFYEGWGMPVVEAQACGVPVLTTDNSSLPEAGGQAAEYAQTGDQADLNKKLAELLANPKRRQELRTLGLKHAANFSWTKSAEQLTSLFDRLLK